MHTIPWKNAKDAITDLVTRSFGRINGISDRTPKAKYETPATGRRATAAGPPSHSPVISGIPSGFDRNLGAKINAKPLVN